MSTRTFEPTISDSGVSLCVGCTAQGACVLGIEEEKLQAEVLTITATCPPERQGIQGVAHGGWVADLLDEALGKRMQLAGQFGVTHSLTVRFHRPTPTEVPLIVTAKIAASGDDRWYITGDLRLADTGALLATGSVTMVPRDHGQHRERFGAWLGSGAGDSPSPRTPGTPASDGAV